jgi:hypothetical protein
MDGKERSLIDLVREAADIEGRVARKPYSMVAGAMGVGFVLGGGLFTRLTERLAGAALRVGILATWPMVQEEIGRQVRRMASGAGSEKQKGEPL